MTRISRIELKELASGAMVRQGASEELARVLVDAADFAEARGKAPVGYAHLKDYVDAIRDGRCNPKPAPTVTRTAPGVWVIDADQGPQHLGFDRAFQGFVDSVRSQGMAMMSQHNALAGGQLAWYTERLASEGLVAFACVNSNALMAPGQNQPKVLGTNPLAYSIPHSKGVVTVDQAASNTAFVRLRQAADRGESIPEGWAVDAQGRPTTDAAAARDGALLPSGGYKGANIAFMVEFLATLSGARFAVDAPPFDSGPENTGIGFFLFAIDPAAVTGGAEADPESARAAFTSRISTYLQRMTGMGVRAPGSSRPAEGSSQPHSFDVDPQVLDELRALAD